MPKMLIAVLKNQKIFQDDMKENLHFEQSRLSYINNQKQELKRTHKIGNSLYLGRCSCRKPLWELCLEYYQNL